jgi:D-aspartate ligase
MTSNTKPSAVVVGAGLNALGVVRSLAPERIPITVVANEPGPALRSRFATPSRYREDLVGHLASLPAHDKPVLLLTQEAAVAAVSEERERLKDRYRFVLAEPRLLAGLMSKSGFQSLAAKHGFPVPRSEVVTCPSDLARVSALSFPCIVKPVVKNDAWDRRFQKAYRFDEFSALDAFFAGNMPPPAIVQEWIEGTDADVYFTLAYRDGEGATRAAFTGRKIRQWPPRVGGTASCTAAPAEHEALLAALTTRFFDAVGFVGMGSMEYKRDPRTGRFVMVEPTVGRSDYQEEVSTLNGVNVVRAAYRSLAGLPPLEPEASRGPRVWRDGIGDERSRAAQPDLPVPESVKGAAWVDALFRVNDPGPWLADLYGRIAARAGIGRS